MDCKKNVDVILAEWQTCVEMANSVSQRRDSMNNIFVTLNLAVITAVSFTWNIKFLFILLAGALICVIWIFSIRNYKMLNQEKFKVINKIEKELPVMPFNEEWSLLKMNKKYMDGTMIETFIPIIFIGLYIIAIIVVIYCKFKSNGGV